MDKRFILFLALTIAVLALNQIIAIWLFPQPPAVQQPAKVAKVDAKQAEAKPGEAQLKEGGDAVKDEAPAKADAAKDAAAENAEKPDAAKPAESAGRVATPRARLERPGQPLPHAGLPA